MNKRIKFSKATLSLLAIIGFVTLAQAQDGGNSDSFMNIGLVEILWTITLLLGGMMLFLVGVMLRLIRMLHEEKMGEPGKPKRTLWMKILSLRPIEEEKDMMIDHTYDGIQELDNPTPPWFNFLFYGTILWGVVYLIYYHVMNDGMIQENEYQAELVMWEAKTANYLANQTDLIDETNVTLVTDPALLESAAVIFKAKCAACHGELGEGKNGPNLTDDYALHGGTIQDLFRTITVGVPEKGMIPWKGLLKPEEIQNMASYILSIKGSLPPGTGKEPEGEKIE